MYFLYNCTEMILIIINLNLKKIYMLINNKKKKKKMIILLNRIF